MGLLEGGEKSRSEGQGWNSRQQWFLGTGQHLVSLPGSSPTARFPCRGQQGSPHRPRPRVALRVLAMGVLVELFAGSGLYGDGKSCVLQGQLHRTADMREGHLSFSPLSSPSKESSP